MSVVRASRIAALILSSQLVVACAIEPAPATDPTVRVITNVAYSRVPSTATRLDLRVPRDLPGRHPVFVYFHGGGWADGTRQSVERELGPFLAAGFAVVNVSYRLSREARAPAAIDDARCALRWVAANADAYGLDAERVVVSGNSTGAHLSLMAGLLAGSDSATGDCARGRVRVAAIVNWFGVTDVDDLLHETNLRYWAAGWIGPRSDRNARAVRFSPLSWVDRTAPPIITVHGDADDSVPYAHAVRLHEKLQALGRPNELVTIAGGGHGDFDAPTALRAHARVLAFVAAQLAPH
jgi:acetyl esterase/lipase